MRLIFWCFLVGGVPTDYLDFNSVVYYCLMLYVL